MRLRIWNAATNGHIVHPPDDIYEYGVRRWNDTDRGKLKNLEKNLSQCHFVHNKSHMDWPALTEIIHNTQFTVQFWFIFVFISCLIKYIP
jgi:hypothetical protein